MKCIFIGHRDCINIENKVYQQINKLIEQGIMDFYSGGMGNFDILCEKTVKLLGGKIVYIPYNINIVKERDKFWYDDIICPFGNKEYSKSDISERNKWLVDNADLCLCYVYKNGGAMKTLNYAIKRNKRIINLYNT